MSTEPLDERKATSAHLASRPRSPRAAALAGIVFSVLTIVIIGLMRPFWLIDLEELGLNSLDAWADTAAWVLALLPFAGIAFLWFTGVMRDRLADKEDQFFSTIFMGSGLLFLGTLFVWGAGIGAIFRLRPLAGTQLIDNGVIIYGIAFIDEIVAVYGLRMAGIYMVSSATLWVRTGVMPRWLVILTYVVAVIFLIFAGSFREARFGFPVWVFVVSAYILAVDRRRNTTHDQ